MVRPAVVLPEIREPLDLAYLSISALAYLTSMVSFCEFVSTIGVSLLVLDSSS